MAFEHQVEHQIRRAQANGAFDALPGAGRPLPADPPGEHDGTWWAREYVRREGLPTAVLLTPGLALKREAADVHETVARLRTDLQVIAHVEDLNRRIRAEIFLPSPGPAIILREIDPDEVLIRWCERRATLVTQTPVAPPAEVPPNRRRWWQRRSG